MPKANWMAPLIVAALLPAAGLAEGPMTFDKGIEVPPLSAFSLDSQPADPATAPRPQPAPPVETFSRSDSLSWALQDFDFRDSGLLGRISGLRGLAFLTLAESGKSRLFLGVNREGLVGLHFDVFPRHGKRRYLEVARMPYLRTNEQEEAE